MVLYLDEPVPSQHYHDNLERYVEKHPGEVVVITHKPYGTPSEVVETFYSVRRYETMIRRAQTRMMKEQGRSDRQIGGGVIGNSAMFLIPTQTPLKIVRNRR